jgi:hypothetical protein
MNPSVSLLWALKREFGFYCIELCALEPVEPVQPEAAFVMGEMGDGAVQPSMERYDASSDLWSTMASMSTARCLLDACAVVGELCDRWG